MKKKLVMLLSILMVALLAVTLTACDNDDTSDNETNGTDTTVETGSGDENGGDDEAPLGSEDNPVTLTIFSRNHNAPNFSDRIAQEITRITGVYMEIQLPTGDADERLTLSLAAHDYPDIVWFNIGSDVLHNYIDAGALLPLDEFFEDGRLGDVYPMISEIKPMMRNLDDGLVYWIPSWYGAVESPATAFNLRFDLMVELVGYERATSPVPFTQEEIIQVFRDYMELNPDGIALTTTPGSATWTLQGMFGMYEYYHRADGTLGWRTEAPGYLEMVRFLNQLQREGLLDPEWVTLSGETIDPKLATGDVLGYINAWWAVNQANSVLIDYGPDVQFVPFQVLGEGVERGTFGSMPFLGWNAFGITDNVTDLDAALRLVNFMASREGQNLIMWGIEGEDYTVASDGTFIPTDSIIELYHSNPGDFSAASGIHLWEWFVANEGPFEGAPRTISDAIRRIDAEQSITERFVEQNLAGTTWNSSSTYGLLPSGGTIGLQVAQVRQIMDEAFPLMVNAATEEEMMEHFERMQADLETAGIHDVMDAVNENYIARKEIWGDWASPSRR